VFLFSRDFLRSVCIFDGNSVFMFLDYVSLFVMCNMRLFVDAKKNWRDRYSTNEVSMCPVH